MKLKKILNLFKSKKTTNNTSNDRFIIKNNYGVEKDIVLRYNVSCVYFIPVIYQKGIFKLHELPYLSFSVEEFNNLSLSEKQELFDKYSFWYKIEDRALSNDFNVLHDENNIGIDNIEISYIDYKDKKGFLNKIAFQNSKNSFQFFDKEDITKLENIIEKLSKEAADSIFEFIKKETNNEEIFRMFLEYYGDGEMADILFTIGTKEDYNNITKKYLESHDSRESEEELKEYLKNSPGDYSKKFTVKNIEEINSYYCSFAECGVIFKVLDKSDDFNNFLYEVGTKIKKQLEKKISKLNLSEDFEFLEPTIYD